jgi:hypothetical protein
MKLIDKTLKQKQKEARIRRGYGKWDWLLADKPTRQRECILWETVVSSAPKTSAKYAGNQ